MKFKDIQTKIKLIYLYLTGKISKSDIPIEINEKNKKLHIKDDNQGTRKREMKNEN